MLTSKLNRKGETIVPKPVRNVLRLREGDDLVYELDKEKEQVILTRGRKTNPFVAFTEWDSAADEEAYADL